MWTMQAFGCLAEEFGLYPRVDKKITGPFKPTLPWSLGEDLCISGHSHPKHTLLHSHPLPFLSTHQTLLLDLQLGEGLGSSLPGQPGSATLASVHREPGGFPQDYPRRQADHQQTLGHGSPSKEAGAGLGMGHKDIWPRTADLYLACRLQRAWHSLKSRIISIVT